MMLYIASDKPLPLVEWREDEPAFNVTELSGSDVQVKKQFDKSYVVFAGAHTGCSCGFNYGELPIEDQDDELEDRRSRDSVGSLAQYLSERLRYGPVELFSCWDGDQNEKPEQKLTVSIDYFGGQTFRFDEKQFLVLTER